jgi:thiol-disulfide isomerase/thioredoxin
MMPVAANMVAWASDPAMSCGARRWSYPIEALIASIIASGPAAKRPPHIVFAVLVMRKKPMRKLKSALLYTALAVVANTASADMAAIEALREGNMRKLMFHETGVASSDAPFLTEAGEEMTLSAYEGQFVVLNFWATWCAPCRQEMPQLAALQAQMGGDDMQVVTVATGRNPAPAINQFFDEIDVDNLPKHVDPRQSLSRSMGVLGLPVTVVLDREGNEIARMQGEADWSSDSAVAVMQALIDAGA